MNIQFVGDGVDIDSHIKDLIQTKLSDEIEVLLTDFEEDLKVAHVKLEKIGRGGFKINFDMRLPGSNGHIYSEETGDDLQNVLVALKREVLRQVKEYKDRLQDYRQ